MTKITRKHIWPAALMSLAVFGVVAAVVALSAMTPQTTQAHAVRGSFRFGQSPVRDFAH